MSGFDYVVSGVPTIPIPTSPALVLDKVNHVLYVNSVAAGEWVAVTGGGGGGGSTDDITNDSTVAGATASDALDTLSTSDGIANAANPFLGATVTDAVTSLEALFNSVPPPTLPPGVTVFDASGGSISTASAFTVFTQTSGVGTINLAAGSVVGQMVIVTLTTSVGAILHTSSNDFTEDGSSSAPAASVFLIWTGAWQLVASQGVNIT